MISRIAISVVALCVAAAMTAQAGRVRRAVEPVPGLYIVVLEANAAPSAAAAGDQPAENQESEIAPEVLDALAAADAAFVRADAEELLATHGGVLRFLYSSALKGFSAELSVEQAEALAGDPRVRFVEEVSVVELSASQSLPLDDKLWHLDRVDQRGSIFLGDGDKHVLLLRVWWRHICLCHRHWHQPRSSGVPQAQRHVSRCERGEVRA